MSGISSRAQLYSMPVRRKQNQPSLSVNRESWLRDEPKFVRLAAEKHDLFMKNHDFKCVYCGFKSHTNKILVLKDNLSTQVIMCPLCIAPTSIGYAMLNNWGELAILPEMTQTEINDLFRWFFLAELASNLELDKTSWIYKEEQDFIEKIRELSKLNKLEQKFRNLFSDRGETQLRKFFNSPVATQMFFPIALSKINDTAYASRSETLSALKFIPNQKIFTTDDLVTMLKEIDFSSVIMQKQYDQLGQR